MNITYIIGVVACLAVMVLGMAGGFPPYDFTLIARFIDPPSIMITVCCTFAIVVASFPASALKEFPKHFIILIKNRKSTPGYYIEQLVQIAQKARKEGILSLENIAKEEKDAFFRQAIMLIVDANDPDRVRAILNNEIECMSARHEAVAGMYDKGAAIAPSFGMVGTLVGLINMLKGMNLDSGGASSIGTDMGTALITTLYGCVLAHVLFSPIANNLRIRDEEEVLCKQIIVEGISCIQAGENPKFLQERLYTFVAEKQRSAGDSGKKAKKGKKEA